MTPLGIWLRLVAALAALTCGLLACLVVIHLLQQTL
jgi:hypothetical protein